MAILQTAKNSGKGKVYKEEVGQGVHYFGGIASSIVVLERGANVSTRS